MPAYALGARSAQGAVERRLRKLWLPRTVLDVFLAVFRSGGDKQG
jgi:hypothetical protein